MLKHFRKKYLWLALIILISVCLGGSRTVLSADPAQTLQNIRDEQARLKQQLAQIEDQIAVYQKQLKTVQGQKNTLANKLNQLAAEQAELKLEIQATTLKVDELGYEMALAQNSIGATQSDIAHQQKQIGNIIELISENDRNSPLEVILSHNTIAEFLAEADDYTRIIYALKEVLDKNQQLKKDLEAQQQQLSDDQEETRNLLALQGLQQADLSESIGTQSVLLKETKNKESNYQASLSDSEKQAKAIRGRMYELLDVENQINFGQAVEIAQWASGLTNVRAAFLLSILTQESNLGKNVGTCNRKGDPPSKSWKVIMHPTRDQPPYLEIVKALGRDPDTTPLSCPMHDKNGKQIGWGGAMGPAQFIPSTWMGYKDKVAAITGKPADPWDIRDAFLAAAIKLAAGGATTKSGEWAAAMRYFSGGTNPAYSFYGDSVVERANQYQEDIDKL